MNYEMVLIPMNYQQHMITGSTCRSSCILCEEELVDVESFTNVEGDNPQNTDYEGKLKMCVPCTMPHLELVQDVVDFQEPVVIGWN